MLNALDTDTQVKEPISAENIGPDVIYIDLVSAEQHEQLMRNMCPDEIRSFI